jgi:hypothetical protein
MKKFLLSTLIISLFSILNSEFASAQDYHLAIGGRWGKMNSGLSAKYMMGAENNKGLQLDLYRTYIYSRGWTAKLFFVKQAEIRSTLLQIPLDWIWGVGAHVGYFPNDRKACAFCGTQYCDYLPGGCSNYDKSIFSFGLDATLQLEYRVPWQDLPLSVSVDGNIWGLGQKLSSEFLNKGAEWIDFGFTVRYCFTGK